MAQHLPLQHRCAGSDLCHNQQLSPNWDKILEVYQENLSQLDAPLFYTLWGLVTPNTHCMKVVIRLI